MDELDAISVVEAAYSLDGDEKDWLRKLGDVLGLDQGLGYQVCVMQTHGQGHSWASLGGTTVLQQGTPPGYSAAARQLFQSMGPRARRCLLFPEAPLITMSSVLPRQQDVVAENPLHGIGVADAVRAFVSDQAGTQLVFTGLRSSVATVHRSVRQIWGRLAPHICAGYWLRRMLTKASEACDPLAPLCPQSREGMLELDARRRLRAVAKQLDRARTRRLEPDEALMLWRQLLCGGFSRVEQFDAVGSHLVVAMRGVPSTRDPRGLTYRERQVVELTELGHSNKAIAAKLGLRRSNVSAHQRRALRKLGVESAQDLRRLGLSMRGATRADARAGARSGGAFSETLS
ncbi:MAG: helix-turn-helix transcriptional regulator [Myxococcales bacterium]|nr:helix-turn-helix transcriptional regulator [Myxococcales bacterium]